MVELRDGLLGRARALAGLDVRLELGADLGARPRGTSDAAAESRERGLLPRRAVEYGLRHVLEAKRAWFCRHDAARGSAFVFFGS